MNTIENMLRGAKRWLRIVGTNPLVPYLEQSARLLTDLLLLNDKLNILILCESDTENFHQALCANTRPSQSCFSFAALSVHRDRIIGTGQKDGLVEDMRHLLATDGIDDSILVRIDVRQVNLRLPLNVIDVDGNLLCCIGTNSIPTVDSYFPITEGRLRSDVIQFIDFYTNPATGGAYLSRPRDEMIQAYDTMGIPRAVFPRSCFYTTRFARYSVWGFVFNRRGHLLLQQRSPLAKDGCGLWDKSIGGHVDLGDSSTSITAMRELVEEMFLPQAEYTEYIRADLGDIVNFGDWYPRKRPEATFKEAFAGLGVSDWAMLRATDLSGVPLTVTRISNRQIHDHESSVLRKTIFRSDVYLFIAPAGYLDSEEQLAGLLSHNEKKGAASGHRLISIAELREWIEEEERKGAERQVFTDDILFLTLQWFEWLERFAEFVSSIFRGDRS